MQVSAQLARRVSRSAGSINPQSDDPSLSPSPVAWTPAQEVGGCSVFDPLFWTNKITKKREIPRGTSGPRGGFLNDHPRAFAKTCTAPRRQTTWVELATHISKILLLFWLSSGRALGGLMGAK